MIICSNCQEANISGALYCNKCGSQLVSLDGTPAVQTLPSIDYAYQQLVTNRLASPPEEPSLTSKVALHIMDTGKTIPLAGREDFTLGRSVDDAPSHPEINLNAYGAYEKGVSRIHAIIKINNNVVTIADLNSVNVTRVNGKKITSNQPIPLNHGDIFTLGKMKFQVFIRK